MSPPATAATLPPPEPTGLANEARERSREHYGRAREEVEAALRARHDARPGTGSIGRAGGSS